jgi:signal peptidase I
VNWNIVNFGPLYLPVKGDVIEMSPKYVALYRNAIEWEQKKKLFLRGDTILLNDSVIRTYRFKENYYFVAGDKVMNSQDSRYWGLLPEPFIVGKAVRIWKSVDRETDRIRWNRIFKKIE